MTSARGRCTTPPIHEASFDAAMLILAGLPKAFVYNQRARIFVREDLYTRVDLLGLDSVTT